MLLTGEKVSAEKAKEIGLVNDCFAKDKLETTVLELANKISSSCSSGTNVIFMSNGSFSGLQNKVLKLLKNE